MSLAVLYASKPVAVGFNEPRSVMEYKDAAATGSDVAIPAMTRVVRVRPVLQKIQVFMKIYIAKD